MNAMKIVTETDTLSFQSWATPYALSIYGEEMYHNCPFKNGNGYGDGRAISVAEVYNSNTNLRLEFQLKGSGTTPFSRSADGRAVLRSSVREFLASEAMYYLGVETTRALSLIASKTGKIERPWFSPDKQISLNDPRLKDYPIEYRREVLKYANSQPDVLIQEIMAIACRVAPSFLRVGHIELYARRYRGTLLNSSNSQQEQVQVQEKEKRLRELKLIVFHMLFREYSHLLPNQNIKSVDDLNDIEFQSIILEMLQECSNRISKLTASWIRVGYCQGNFNSDNCLVGGRTMDYGPFGFIERYERKWNMWSGGGEHYSFRHQHIAGEKNFFSLASSIALLLDNDGQQKVMREILPRHEINSQLEVENIYRQKLGLTQWNDDYKHFFQRLDDHMELTQVDYTLFWRQLSLLPEQILSLYSNSIFILPSPCPDTFNLSTILTNEFIFKPFEDIFYDRLTENNKFLWCNLLREWIRLLLNEINGNFSELSNRSIEMKKVSPKYIPREWMLVEAYKQAEKWNLIPLKTLQDLFEHPYDEQPQYEAIYYRKMPDVVLDKGGFTTMTCSS